MKPINRTPENLRCVAGTCPSVHEIDEKRLLVVGRAALAPELAEIPDLAEDEDAIVIDKALLADILPLGKVGQDLVQTPSSQEETPSGHPSAVTLGNAKEKIEALMGDLVDLLSVFIEANVDPRAWKQLLIYAPPFSQGQALSGHLDFEAKARDVAAALGETYVSKSVQAKLEHAIATALREASELGAALRRLGSEKIDALLQEHEGARAEAAAHKLGCDCAWCFSRDTADAIKSLQHYLSRLMSREMLLVNEIERLREALKPFAEAEAHEDMDFHADTPVNGLITGNKVTLGDLRRACAAYYASAPRQIEEPVVSFMEIAGDTASPVAQQQPDTKNLPHPITPETGH